MKILLVAFYK